MSPSVKEKILPFQGQPEMFLRLSGPVDEPSNLAIYSRLFAERGGLYLQSALMLLRAGQLSAGAPEFELGAAQLMTEGRRPDLAEIVLAGLRKTAPKKFLDDPTTAVELIDVEAQAAYRLGEFPRAEKLLRDAIVRYPKENNPYATLLSFHIQNAMQALRRKETNTYSEQIAKGYQVVQSQLTAQPTNVNAWVNFGATFMRLDQHTNAIVPLTRALDLDKNNVTALMNRASSYLKLNQLNLSRQDLERIRTLLPDSPFQVFYGLGEIAMRSNQKKEALGYYEEYLKKAPDSVEKDEIRERVKTLKK